MKKKLRVKSPDKIKIFNILKALDCHRVIATILANRNIETPDQALTFYSPSLSQLRSPFSMASMDAALERIYMAVCQKESILIFGDYDVDGVTATAVLYDFLKQVGATVDAYIPHREKEGYGLKKDHIDSCAIPKGVNLIITVDCGSSSHEAVACALEKGIDLIITDHHEISEDLPQAIAVINPKRKDCPSNLGHLAGVGVAFYLLIGLRKYFRDRKFWHNKTEPNLKAYCDLVALGTIADIVPMVNENRVLTRTGLTLLNQETRPGIKALFRLLNLDRNKVLAEDVIYKIAPRLNVAGRISHASKAFDLLLTSQQHTADTLAETLHLMNSERQTIEKKILNHIIAYLNEHEEILSRKSLVLAHPGWHIGVLGIVAAKLVERYYKPVILISIQDGCAKGSGRSIPGINLHRCLCACADKLLAFGGHALAVGLTLDSDLLKDFESAMEEAVGIEGADKKLHPCLEVDCELNFKEITDKLLNELEDMQPFGRENEEPLFLSRDIHVSHATIIGKYHLKLMLYQPNGATAQRFDAIRFNVDPRTELPRKFDQLVYRLKWNRWNGKKKPQIVIESTEF